MTISEVFEFYNSRVKPVYSKIEASHNTIPIELLFEIHSTFDHLKRIYVGDAATGRCESEDNACRNALSHLKRGALDAYKLELKYFNDDFEKFAEAGPALKLIDNGGFQAGMIAAREEIIRLAKEARLAGTDQDSIEAAFERWSAVSVKISDFREKYFSRQKEISWAVEKVTRFKWKELTVGILIGVAGARADWLFCTVLKPVFAWLHSLIKS